MKHQMCVKLQDALKSCPDVFFNVSGGCGVDTSLGTSHCMDAVGIWFTYCPFCGRRLISNYDETAHHWDWWEDENE